MWATLEARKTPFQRVARFSGYWLEPFERLANRIGCQKAIARKLRVVIWPVLSAKVADRRAEPQQVAQYFIR